MSGTVTYTYIETPIGVGSLRRSDGALIPLDLGNMDYQQFLAWITAGNTPPSGWTGPTNPGAST